MRLEPPDLVLADHAVHGRDGYEVAAFVKGTAGLSHVPVLLMAGAYEAVDADRAARSGCDGVLVKPFEPADVLARFRALVQPPADAIAPGSGSVGARPVALKLVEPTAAQGVSGDDVPPERRGAGRELDAYFNRLDAALIGLRRPGPEPARRARESRAADADDLPTVERLLADVPAASASVDLPSEGFAPTPVERADDPGERTDLSALAEALGARLDGSNRTEHDRSAAAERAGQAGDALVGEVTRRVMERLDPSVVNDAVADAVTRVAERMVREELDRIRGIRD
jgi:CheY-like chemotaxis protein